MKIFPNLLRVQDMVAHYHILCSIVAKMRDILVRILSHLFFKSNHLIQTGGYTVVITGPFTLRVPGATRFSDKFSGVDFKLSAFRNYEKMILFSGGDNDEESKRLLYLN